MLRQNDSMARAAQPRLPVTGKWLWSKGISAVILYLGASPLFLLPGALLLAGYGALVYALPMSALALAFLAGLVQGKRRRLSFLAALVLQGGLCALTLFPIGFLKLFYFLPCLVLMLLYMPALNRPTGMEWPAGLLGYGIAAHLAGQALKGLDVLHSAGPGLSLLFSGYILLCLFLINRYALACGAPEEAAPPKKLLAKNRRMLAVFGSLAIIAACFDTLCTAAEAAFLWLRNAFFTILLFLASLLPPLSANGGRGAENSMDLAGLAGEEAKPGLLAIVLEKIMIVLGLLIAVFLLGYGLYHLARLLKRSAERILARIREYTKALGEGYVDKTESLLDLADITHAAKEKWDLVRKRFSKPPKWGSLSPREQVRRVYALFMARSHAVDPTLTAREALMTGSLPVPAMDAEYTASLYEKARYSSLPISAEEAQAMRDTLRKA